MMMGGMMVIWLIVFIVIALRAKGPLLASRGWLDAVPPERERTPEELARERYARGEIAAPEYQELLVNLLKDRYVEGELDLAEYEERASHVLEEGVLVPADGGARLKARAGGDPRLLSEGRPLPAEEPGPLGVEHGVRPEVVADEAVPSLTRTSETDGPRQSTTAEMTAGSGRKREAHADGSLEALQRRFLKGELTYQEYGEQRRRLRSG